MPAALPVGEVKYQTELPVAVLFATVNGHLYQYFNTPDVVVVPGVALDE
jgi:hypothetical protein